MPWSGYPFLLAFRLDYVSDAMGTMSIELHFFAGFLFVNFVIHLLQSLSYFHEKHKI